MQEADVAIVLGKVQVKNNNHVVKAITQNNGLMSLYVTAGSKKKLAKNAVLEPLSICQIQFSKSKKSSLAQLKEAKLELPLYNIQTDIFKSTIAIFLAEFLQQISPTEPEEDYFNFIVNSLKSFNNEVKGMGHFHLWFMLNCTAFVGIRPTVVQGENILFDLQEGIFTRLVPVHPHYLNVSETTVIQELLQSEISDLVEISIPSVIKRKLIHNILQYYSFHVPGFFKPKSLEVLEDVFS